MKTLIKISKSMDTALRYSIRSPTLEEDTVKNLSLRKVAYAVIYPSWLIGCVFSYLSSLLFYTYIISLGTMCVLSVEEEITYLCVFFCFLFTYLFYFISKMTCFFYGFRVAIVSIFFVLFIKELWCDVIDSFCAFLVWYVWLNSKLYIIYGRSITLWDFEPFNR